MEPRTQEQIYARMRELKTAWKECSKIPGIMELVQGDLLTSLKTLYWVLGHSEDAAIDSALIYLDEEPIDRS